MLAKGDLLPRLLAQSHVFDGSRGANELEGGLVTAAQHPGGSERLGFESRNITATIGWRDAICVPRVMLPLLPDWSGFSLDERAQVGARDGCLRPVSLARLLAGKSGLSLEDTEIESQSYREYPWYCPDTTGPHAQGDQV